MSFPILKIFLTLTNFFLTSFLLILTCDHIFSNNDTQSWGFVFHVLSLVWLFIRGIFWLATLIHFISWTTLSFYLLYWMPAPLEFAAFMLLPLYFTQILYPDEWKKHWKFVRPFYFSFIVGIILFQVLWTWLADSPAEQRCAATTDPNMKYTCFRTEDRSDVCRVVTGICFMFVAAMQYQFGRKVLQLDPQRYAQYFTTPSDVMATVNKFLAFSFATRSAYQFLAVLSDINLPNIPIEAGEGDVDFWVFLLFEFWVYAPTILIVVNVTSKTLHESSIADVGYRVIARTYGAIDPSMPQVSVHAADLEDSVEMRMVHNISTSSRQISAEVPIQLQNSLLQREDSHLIGSISSNHSSYNRKTWLHEPEVRRYNRPGSSHDSNQFDSESFGKGFYLTKYYNRGKRLRSGSMSSDASSGDHINLGGSWTQQENGYGSLAAGNRSESGEMLSDQQFRSQSRANSFGNGFGVASGGRGQKRVKQKEIRFYNESSKSKSSEPVAIIQLASAAPMKTSRSYSFDRGHHQNVFLPTLSSELVRESIEHERTPSLGREMELFHKQTQLEYQKQQEQLQNQSEEFHKEQERAQFADLTKAVLSYSGCTVGTILTPGTGGPHTSSLQFAAGTPCTAQYELQVEPSRSVSNTPTLQPVQQPMLSKVSSSVPCGNPFVFSLVSSSSSNPGTPSPAIQQTASISQSYRRTISRERLGDSLSRDDIVEEQMPPGCYMLYGHNESNPNFADYLEAQSVSFVAENDGGLAPSAVPNVGNNNTSSAGSSVPLFVLPPPSSPFQNFGVVPTSSTTPATATMMASMPTAILPRPSRPSIATSRIIAQTNSCDTPPLSRSISSNPLLMSMLSPSPVINTTHSSRITTPTYTGPPTPTNQGNVNPNYHGSVTVPIAPNFCLPRDPPLTPDSNTTMSFSPGSVLFQRFQAQTNSLTPDRVEAARDAARLRQGLGGGQNSRSFTFSPNL